MGLYIASNPTAFGIWSYLAQDNQAISSLQEHLASGLRIMGAADDPAGLAISESLTAQVNGTNQAEQNVQDANALLATADGGMSSIQGLLQAMYTLSVAAANNTLTTTQVSTDQALLYSYAAEINSIANGTPYNGHELLDGGANAPNDNGWSATLFTVQVGASGPDAMGFSIMTMTQSYLGVLNTQLSIGTVAGASQTMANIQNALNLVSAGRGQVGSYQDVLSSQLSVLQVQSTNLQSANSSITNLDVAQASAQLASEQLMAASATAMLAQANSAPSMLLTLLGLPAPSNSSTIA